MEGQQTWGAEYAPSTLALAAVNQTSSASTDATTIDPTLLHTDAWHSPHAPVTPEQNKSIPLEHGIYGSLTPRTLRFEAALTTSYSPSPHMTSPASSNMRLANTNQTAPRTPSMHIQRGSPATHVQPPHHPFFERSWRGKGPFYSPNTAATSGVELSLSAARNSRLAASTLSTQGDLDAAAQAMAEAALLEAKARRLHQKGVSQKNIRATKRTKKKGEMEARRKQR